MDFSQFAKILYSVFADGINVDAFTQELFLNITDYSESEDNPVETYTFPTFKSYYNGTNGISGIAKKINKHIDTVKFAAYINGLPDGATDNLCDALKPYIEDVTAFNASEKCAGLFKEIIITAAGTTKKKATPAIRDGSTTAVAAISAEKYQTRLLIESKGLCPNDNCCQPLYIDAGGQTQMDYTVTIINPALPHDSFSNLIALCPDCSKRYLLSQDTARIKRMDEIKKQLMEEAETMGTLAGTKVEEGVERVLRKIADTPPDQIVPLTYDPVEIRQKILPANRALYIKAKAYVSEYYNTVHGIFQLLSKEGKLRFEPFCMQVRLNFINLRDKGIEQPEIFEKLVDWLAANTNDSRDMCEIVIAYFIQKCEVFDAITK